MTTFVYTLKDIIAVAVLAVIAIVYACAWLVVRLKK